MYQFCDILSLYRWLTKDFRSEGRLSIGSTGYKNLYIAFGLGGSGLDAKGGIVGGNIEIANIDTFSKYINLLFNFYSRQETE